MGCHASHATSLGQFQGDFEALGYAAHQLTSLDMQELNGDFAYIILQEVTTQLFIFAEPLVTILNIFL